MLMFWNWYRNDLCKFLYVIKRVTKVTSLCLVLPISVLPSYSRFKRVITFGGEYYGNKLSSSMQQVKFVGLNYTRDVGDWVLSLEWSFVVKCCKVANDIVYKIVPICLRDCRCYIGVLLWHVGARYISPTVPSFYCMWRPVVVIWTPFECLDRII